MRAAPRTWRDVLALVLILATIGPLIFMAVPDQVQIALIVVLQTVVFFFFRKSGPTEPRP